MLGEISKHFKFMETHAGFYLGVFVWGRGESILKEFFGATQRRKNFFLGFLRGSGGTLPQNIFKR